MDHEQSPDIATLLAWAQNRLARTADQPALEARLLLAEATGESQTALFARPEARPDSNALKRFESLVKGRCEGTPVAYLLGRRDFRQLSLSVGPATLIPRPETELLVDVALEIAPARSARVIDLGTGSGAVALALKEERTDWEVMASDSSPAALEIARENATRLGLEVSFLAGDLFAPLAPGPQFDLVVSNPPYVPEADPHLSQGDVAREPRQALAAGKDGLAVLRRCIAAAPGYLRKDGALLLEHGHDQGPAVRSLLAEAGLRAPETRTDLAGHDRISLAYRSD